MEIKWLGTASVLIKSKDAKIVTDPFPGIPADPEAEAYMKEVDNILVSHGHFDHICAIKDIYPDKKINIYCTKTPKETLTRSGIDEKLINEISPGGSFETGDLKVDCFQGRHGVFDAKTVLSAAVRIFTHPARGRRILKLHRSHPENGETLFFEITDGGSRLQIIGSPGLDERTVYPTGADALVLAYQGRADLEDTVMPFIKRLAPKKVFLDHYDDTFYPMSSDVDVRGIVKRVRDELGIPCVPLEKYKTEII